ncbi:hypothetical protein BDW67DRAFT_186022 [Aspergillus spinulosporus]
MWLCIVKGCSDNTVQYGGAAPPIAAAVNTAIPSLSTSPMFPLLSAAVALCKVVARPSEVQRLSSAMYQRSSPIKIWEKKLENVARSSQAPHKPTDCMFCINPSDCGLGACWYNFGITLKIPPSDLMLRHSTLLPTRAVLVELRAAPGKQVFT